MNKLCEVMVLSALLLVLYPAAFAQTNGADEDWAPASPDSSQEEAPTKARALTPPAAATVDPTYLIGSQDVLEIEVWKEKDLSVTVPVRPDGKISLPLVDDVQAAGLTAMQLSASLRDQLKKYLAQPRVTVVVEQVNSRQVYVLGEVLRPGVFPLTPHMTVLQAIAKAGGLTQFAHKKKIRIKRFGDQEAERFNYASAVKGESPDVDLGAGDTIIVQ